MIKILLDSGSFALFFFFFLFFSFVQIDSAALFNSQRITDIFSLIIYLFIHSDLFIIYSPIDSLFIHLFIHSFIHSFIHLFIYLFICLFIYLLHFARQAHF